MVAVMRDGKVFFGTDQITPDAVDGQSEGPPGQPSPTSASIIRADARAKFGRVVEVVDNVRAAGVDQLGLLTDQKKKSKARPQRRHRAPTGGQ